MKNSTNGIHIFAARKPFFFALIFFMVSYILDSGIILALRPVMALTVVGIIDVVAQAVLALGVLAWLGWLQAVGFNRPADWRSLNLLWLPALLALFYLASALSLHISGAVVVLLAVLTALLTGVDEEARFRGVIVEALLPAGPFKAATLSGAFFGLSHVNNLLTGAPPLIVLFQVIGAFLLGFGLAACRLRTRTIWPLILFHMLYDLPAYLTLFNSKSVTTIIAMQMSLSPQAIAIVLVLPGFILALYGLFLLRPSYRGFQVQR